MVNLDYYKVLGVAKDSSQDEIKAKYRKLAMQFHPDRNEDDQKIIAEAKFKEVKEAYECLGDVDKRASYDRHGHPPTGNAPHPDDVWGNDINEMFRHAFNSANPDVFSNIFRQSAERQNATRNNITISLEDAYVGRQIHQSGHIINIPPGVRSGTKIYAGSAIYQITVSLNSKFKRSNDDLLIDVNITAIEAMLGVEAILTHLNGVKMQFTIPIGIQHGQVVRLANKGMMNPETSKYGDLMVRIAITTPKSLTDEQYAFLKTMHHRDIFDI